MLAKKRIKIVPRPKPPKTAKQLERHLKGVANHRRIEILFLIDEREGIRLDGIAKSVKGNIKTISEHTRKLAQAGLVNKTYANRGVSHTLSPYGKRFLKFIKSF
jgi:DNA-binding MarR family transcriptional regulator